MGFCCFVDETIASLQFVFTLLFLTLQVSGYSGPEAPEQESVRAHHVFNSPDSQKRLVQRRYSSGGGSSWRHGGQQRGGRRADGGFGGPQEFRALDQLPRARRFCLFASSSGHRCRHRRQPSDGCRRCRAGSGRPREPQTAPWSSQEVGASPDRLGRPLSEV